MSEPLSQTVLQIAHALARQAPGKVGVTPADVTAAYRHAAEMVESWAAGEPGALRDGR